MSEDGWDEIVDPDVDLHDPRQRDEIAPREWDLLLAVAAGGVVGAESRYGLAEALPHHPGSWPWATLLTNGLGCLLIGVLMVVLLEIARPHRLWRPFLGVGVLGGFTTFSTFSADVHSLLLAHRAGVALAYAAASLLACLGAVAVAVRLTRALARTRSLV
jgi:fluoride exporter